MKSFLLSPNSQSMVSIYTRNRQTGQPTVQTSKPVGMAPLKTVWLLVKTNAYKRLTNQLRTAKNGLQKHYKLNLHAVTPAGRFAGRKLDSLITRSGWLVLDFDDLLPLEIASLSTVLLQDPTLGPSIVLAFISPRGAGLKVWVRINLDFGHLECFTAIVAHLNKEHPVYAAKVDPSGKDITRLCLLCHDPNAYFNSEYATAPPFPMPPAEVRPSSGPTSSGPIIDWQEVFDDKYNPNAFRREVNLEELERLVSAAEQVPNFADNRKKWLKLCYAFVSIGEQGRPYFHRVSQTSAKYNEAKNDKKFDYCLNHTRAKISLRTFYHFCKEAGIPLTQDTPTAPLSTLSDGVIPQELYSQAPLILRDACAAFEGNAHRQAVMFLSTLGAISGCVPGVAGYYDGKQYGLNLFIFITAPPGSGKSTMLWAQRLITGWHKRLMADSNAAQEEYEAKAAEHKATSARGPLPVAPPQQLGILAGNTTGVALIDRLHRNGGRGTIIESEVATIVKALGGEHGNFSDVLCAIAQEEPIRYARKGGDTYVEIERPKASILTTGVPEQIGQLFRSMNDGLISRFLHHSYEQPLEWRSGRPSESKPLDDYFDQLALRFDQFLAQVPQLTEDGKPTVEFTLAEADWDKVDAQAKQMLAEAKAVAGSIGASSTFRLAGLITFRIIGLLTILHRFDEGKPITGTIEASSLDVEIALKLSAVSHVHGLKILDSLIKAKTNRAQSTKADEVAKDKELVKQLRSQNPPMPYRAIQRQYGIPSNNACRWAKEMGLK